MREGKGLGFTCPLSFTVVTTLTCKVARKAASTKETTSGATTGLHLFVQIFQIKHLEAQYIQ